MSIDFYRVVSLTLWYVGLLALVGCAAVGWRRNRHAAWLLLAAAGVYAVWRVLDGCGLPTWVVLERLGLIGPDPDVGQRSYAHMAVISASHTVLTALVLGAVLVGRRPGRDAAGS